MRKLEEFLRRKPVKPTRCRTCQQEEVAEVVAEFARKRNSAQTNLSWRYFYTEFLVKELGYRETYYTMMNHVRGCLCRES